MGLTNILAFSKGKVWVPFYARVEYVLIEVYAVTKL
jgi:hypothetical protein